MKLNKKGFTLVELLVVIVILIGISMVAVPNISKTLSQRKEKEIAKDIEIMLEYTMTYASSNMDIYKCLKDENGYIDLKELSERKNIELKTAKQSDLGYAIYNDGKIESSDTPTTKNCLE